VVLGAIRLSREAQRSRPYWRPSFGFDVRCLAIPPRLASESPETDRCPPHLGLCSGHSMLPDGKRIPPLNIDQRPSDQFDGWEVVLAMNVRE
jgi:hypothetical protein